MDLDLHLPINFRHLLFGEIGILVALSPLNIAPHLLLCYQQEAVMHLTEYLTDRSASTSAYKYKIANWIATS